MYDLPTSLDGFETLVKELPFNLWLPRIIHQPMDVPLVLANSMGPIGYPGLNVDLIVNKGGPLRSPAQQCAFLLEQFKVRLFRLFLRQFLLIRQSL